MALPALESVLRNVSSQLNLSTKLAQIHATAVDLAPSETPPFGLDAVAFQFWPETLTTPYSSEWVGKRVAGASHPIYSWVAGSEAPISFQAVFATDYEPPASTRGNATLPSFDTSPAVDKSRYVDVRAMVKWLRWFTLPTYGTRGNDMRVYEPAKMLLVAPNLGLGQNGDEVTVLLKSANVVYEQCFPSGYPRVAVVDLEFLETVQRRDRVEFRDRKGLVMNAGSMLRVRR